MKPAEGQSQPHGSFSPHRMPPPPPPSPIPPRGDAAPGVGEWASGLFVAQRLIDEAKAGAALYWALYYTPDAVKNAPEPVLRAYAAAQKVFGSPR
jgi:hypothetical protein